MRVGQRYSVLLIALVLAGCAAAPTQVTPLIPAIPAGSSAAPGSSSVQMLDQIVAALAGEWDNHQQLWLAKQSATGEQPPALPRLHYSLQPLQAPKIGRRLFLVQQTGGGLTNGKVRLRVWRFAVDNENGGVRQDVYAFRQSERYIALLQAGQLPELKHEDLVPTPGCSLRWTAVAADGWLGSMAGQQCSAGDRLGELPSYVRDQLYLQRNQLTVESTSALVGQRAPPPVELKMQRASRFEGWLAINPAGPSARSGDAQRPWHTRKDLRLHDGGQRLEVLWDDGTPSGWSLELARLQYPNAAEPILRLDLIEDNGGRVLTYVWAGAASTQIGMNLGWFQVGLTRADALRTDP